jgi:hypothetical protein
MKIYFKEKELKLTPLMYEYMQAFKMICFNETWEWTLTIFVKEFLKKNFDECTAILSSSSFQITKSIKAKRILAFYLLLQAQTVSQMCPKVHESYASALNLITQFQLNQMKTNLAITANLESFLIECIQIECLLYLLRFDANNIFTHIKTWSSKYIKNKQNTSSLKTTNNDYLNFKIPLSLENEIKFSQNFYKEKIPNNNIIIF